jgi:hypothetical protein
LAEVLAATTLAVGFPLAVALAMILALATTFFPALATGLRMGFVGATLLLVDGAFFFAAGFALVVLREAGFAGRLDFGLTAFLAEGLAECGLDLGETFALGRAFRVGFVGFAGFLAMVILDGNSFQRGAAGSRGHASASRRSL